MNRRELIGVSAASLASATLASKALADSNHKQTHGKTAAKSKYADLVASTADCVRDGEICLAHCAKQAMDDSMNMAQCQSKTLEMLAGCEALLRLAAMESKHTKAMANVVQSLCEDCAEECKKHAKHHAECAASYDSCMACAKACKALA